MTTIRLTKTTKEPHAFLGCRLPLALLDRLNRIRLMEGMTRTEAVEQLLAWAISNHERVEQRKTERATR